MSEIISFACSLDFGCVKLTHQSQGKAQSSDLFLEHVVQMLHLFANYTVKVTIFVYWSKFVQFLKF